jgi:hydroxymethylbilane synthase
VSERPKLVIGTRGSPLALAQAEETRCRLMAAHGLAAHDIGLEIIRTSGDRIQDRPLAEIGGKGLFTKEIEEALLAGSIDLAVHSMKDMPTALPPGLLIAALLPREDVREAFVARDAAGFSALPTGARLGSSSLRRRAQVLRLRPDLEVVPYRGNVETRLRKLDEGEVAATLLAVAGLRRLGLEQRISAAIPAEEMLPAVAQGAIGIEVRADDGRVRSLVAALDDRETAVCLAAERAMLAGLDGSCRTPIAGLARLSGSRLHLVGEVLSLDGARHCRVERDGPAEAAAEIGGRVAAELLAEAGPDLLGLRP